MNTEVLEDVLNCPSLPSLPAVALRVIELTGNPEVSMEELASTIQNDQALAAKVLRTVNSSFYGLREPCTTIRKALVMLGLSPVKSLALGFSLVSSVDMESSPGFPFESYWRRTLFSAVGAKSVAEHARLAIADEAFLAGMLQDIGMIAFSEALGSEYNNMLIDLGNDHSKLVRKELELLELQHPDVGAMLAERWRLPFLLTGPIKFHERPTAAPNEIADITRCVHLGTIAHDCLTDEDPAPAYRRFYKKCDEWYRIKSADAEALFKRINEGTKEMSNLFSLDVGTFESPEEVLKKANRQLIDLSKSEPRESYAAAEFDKIVAGSSETDPLLGIPSRVGFDSILSRSYSECESGGKPITIIQAALAGHAEITRTAGDLAADEALISTVALLHKVFEPLGAIVCRLDESLFGVVLADTDRKTASAAAERFRNEINTMGDDWLTAEGSGGTATIAPKLSVSLGLAVADPETFAFFAGHPRLVLAGSKAVQAARQSGGDCLRAFVPKKAA